MKIVLELNDTECQVLIDCLNEKILNAEARKETREGYWCYTDDVVLDYKVKLRDKIQEFQDAQERLSIDRED